MIASAVLVAVAASVPAGGGAIVPAGFQEQTLFAGLTQPTSIAFSSDGRAFVAEKSGLVKVFDGLSDPTPSVFVDLRTEVHDYWDRGLLDIALAPGFPEDPFVYLLYTYDAAIGGTAPRWGTPGATSDGCPTPPGPTADGCVVSGRLVRVRADGDVASGPEQVLIEGWCQQYPSHSIGSLAFGADGSLYVSGGEGSNFTRADYGQDGDPTNPCGDPPSGVGGVQSPPAAEGGALRAQDVRTSGDPAGLSGAVLRIDPATGAGLPTNPFGSSVDENARRIVAYGFRNPFRLTIRPGTNDVWVGDVGWNTWEEVDHVGPPAAVAPDFGWPCYEGAAPQPAYDALDLSICEDLYAQGPAATRAPAFQYAQVGPVVEGESCTISGGASIAGLAFGPTTGTNYPSSYRGALYFADYSRHCIFVVPLGTDGNPDFTRVQSFVGAAAKPVDLAIGPGGDLVYVDLDGTVRRIVYVAGANRPPIATIQAEPTSGPLPLAVQLDGTRSIDPDGQPVTYAWDLDGDGDYDDATGATPARTYTLAGHVTVGLRVTDPLGATDLASVVITPGNSPPRPRIVTPTSSTRWAVGDVISFGGSADDTEQGSLPPAALRWDLVLHHCHEGGTCHDHPVQSFEGVAGGSVVAPDHEYPSSLELQLTATDAGGLSASVAVELEPETVVTTITTQPPGLTVIVGSSSLVTPASTTTIQGSAISVTAPSPQTLAGTSYRFTGWSDGGARAHELVATTSASLVGTFVPDIPVIVPGSTSVLEGNSGSTVVTIPVALSAASSQTVSASWSTIRPPDLPGSPADPGADYTAASGTVTFPPGATSASVSVPVSGDVLDEADEYVLVSVTAPVNAVMGGYWGLGLGTIVDDDPLPVVLPGTGSVVEGNAGQVSLVVSVRLSAPSGRPVTVRWSTISPGLAIPAADPGVDYVVVGGTVTFAPGETTRTVSIPVIGDRAPEADEAVIVSFTSPTNAAMGGFWGLALATILDDDR